MADDQNTTQLIKYDAACLALANAKDVDEVRQIRSASAALAAYARIAKNKQLEADAAEIRIRAERRVGEMMAAQRATVGLAKGALLRGTKLVPRDQPEPPTLADAGIDKHLATTARKLAAIPEQKFEQMVTTWRENVTDGNARATVDILKPPVHVSHNSGENEWYTPPAYIKAARNVMDGIDCDPASSETANKIVQATVYHTIEDNGLMQPWTGRVWMNPPYSQPEIADFCAELSKRFDTGETTQACVLVNNATDTDWCQRLLIRASAVCLIRGRVRFLNPAGEPVGAPLQGQIVIYLGAEAKRFSEVFNTFGVVFRHEP